MDKHMIITEDKIPKCINFEKCGQIALTIANGKPFCGLCMVESLKILKERREKLLMEE